MVYGINTKSAKMQGFPGLLSLITLWLPPLCLLLPCVNPLPHFLAFVKEEKGVIGVTVMY